MTTVDEELFAVSGDVIPDPEALPEPFLFTPDLLEDLAIETVGRPSDEFAGVRYHLAHLERQRGLRPRTLEPPKTVSHMANPDAADALSGEPLPAVTFMCSGARAEAERTEIDTLDLSVQLMVRINVEGKIKRDTLRRRDLLAFAVVECLIQRLPRHGIVSRCDLFDFAPVEHADDKRIRGEYTLTFNVAIPDAVSLSPHTGPDGDLPSGPRGPYDPPPVEPPVESITPGIVKVPLPENV